MTVHQDDIAVVTAWSDTLAAHVRPVDLIGARSIFEPDMIVFRTFTDFMTGREAAEQQQWRHVWPTSTSSVSVGTYAPSSTRSLKSKPAKR